MVLDGKIRERFRQKRILETAPLNINYYMDKFAWVIAKGQHKSTKLSITFSLSRFFNDHG